MRCFSCRRCGHLVFFENSACLACGAQLGFAWPERDLLTLDDPVRCANAELAACNAIVDVHGQLCFSCSLTRTRPADWDWDGIAEFPKGEAAKRRLLFELLEIGLPIPTRAEHPDTGLAFDLLASTFQPVQTGHSHGVVTIDLAESDDAHREQMRVEMGESYRTLLGHFRHEIGHFYFTVLVSEELAFERFRALFGDEREDYQQALERHYADGPPPDWDASYVSAYATMHPSEDWAETFAHYLHIRDTLQTAVAFGVHTHHAKPTSDHQPIREALDDWLPLTYAMNAMNRSMGRDDLYPFVLSPAAVEKLVLVDELAVAAVVAARGG